MKTCMCNILCILCLTVHLKNARVLQSFMSEGSLLNSAHPLYLRALLLTYTICLSTYNLFTLLYLLFLVDISDWYVTSSLHVCGCFRLCNWVPVS